MTSVFYFPLTYYYFKGKVIDSVQPNRDHLILTHHTFEFNSLFER